VATERGAPHRRRFGEALAVILQAVEVRDDRLDLPAFECTDERRHRAFLPILDAINEENVVALRACGL
jgi:hypothetical protein